MTIKKLVLICLDGTKNSNVVDVITKLGLGLTLNLKDESESFVLLNSHKTSAPPATLIPIRVNLENSVRDAIQRKAGKELEIFIKTSL